MAFRLSNVESTHEPFELEDILFPALVGIVTVPILGLQCVSLVDFAGKRYCFPPQSCPVLLKPIFQTWASNNIRQLIFNH